MVLDTDSKESKEAIHSTVINSAFSDVVALFSVAASSTSHVSSVMLSGPIEIRRPPKHIVDVAAQKHSKYDSLAARNGYKFFAFIFDSFGYMPPESVSAVRALETMIQEQFSDPAKLKLVFGKDESPKKILKDRISAAFYRGTCKLVTWCTEHIT